MAELVAELRGKNVSFTSSLATTARRPRPACRAPPREPALAAQGAHAAPGVKRARGVQVQESELLFVCINTPLKTGGVGAGCAAARPAARGVRAGARGFGCGTGRQRRGVSD